MVVCVLAPRDPSNFSSLKGAVARRIGYTLHHKIFLVDCAANGHVASTGERRRLLAFIGGLDPTDHDYDTPAHSLYSWRKDHK
jgi:phosphatidylserine/phosphatidylglycerophosphate/cardiolipin synthase-like enzyme